MKSEQIDSLWDFDDPATSFSRLQEALRTAPESADEIRTQLARALGLQRRFKEAWAEIAEISSGLSPIVAVRVALESGRLENSSGNKARAQPYFLDAYRRAGEHGFDFYTIDAAHMLGIVTAGATSLAWNERAIALAQASEDRRAQNWAGSLLNNTGWTYHDMGQFDKALDLFRKALAFQQAHGKEQNIRIAIWSVGRCLRSLKRYDEALSIQRGLEGGPEEGYVSEELAELLLVTGQVDLSRPYFRRAYEKLSKDIWLKSNEPARLERLSQLGS